MKFNYNEHRRWVSDNGDNTHRINYNLTDKSIVFDLGGYMGEWSEKINLKYNPTIYIFEPIKMYYELIVDKFKENKNIFVFNFALGEFNGEINIYHDKDGSSIIKKTSDVETIKVKSIKEFIVEHEILTINLIKINIEGAEFNLLDFLIENEIQNKIENIQVQFHYLIDEPELRRDKIRNKLSKTHNCTYNYEFIWENWEKK